MKSRQSTNILSAVNAAEYSALARELVAEYVQATAVEMDTNPQEFLPFIDGYSEFPGVFANKGDFLIAFVDEEAAGCLGIKMLTDSTCEMKSLWLRPEYRGRGVAQELIRFSLQRAKALGYSQMTLDVLPTRLGPIRLYEKLGFVQGPLSHEYTFEMVGYRIEL